MDRLLGGLPADVFASLAAVATFLGTARRAEGASRIAVCGYGHGVGLSQYGAKGRAETGQGYGRIVRTYYRGVGLKKYRGNLPVTVLLGARARGAAFEFYGDVRDQVYCGFSAGTAPTNRTVTGTAHVYAAYAGRLITAFFHSANGRTTETAANVFGNPVPYLRSFRDVDGSGRAYEGRAHARSPWMRWEGKLDPNGSPQFGVGSIESVKVLDRAPAGRLEKIRIKGSDGQTTLSGQQEIRFGLKSTGIQRNDGSSFPGGAMPSVRAFFGGACG